MRTGPGRVFVARERELAELRSGLDAAREREGRLFLVSGDAGIGKTSLAEVVAADAEAAGMQVLWGRCWQGDGAPPYWPWVQVVRSSLRRHAVEPALLARLAVIVPELRQDAEAPQLEDGEQHRFALFDAMAQLLTSAAGDAGAVLLLDDLHAADPSSLLLLEFVAGELRRAPVLLVGTYRDLEARHEPRARVALGRLAGAGTVLPLTKLTAAEVARLVSLATGADPHAGVIEAIHAATGGNPFLVDGLARLMAAEGSLDGAVGARGAAALPAGVQQGVARRLGFVREAAAELLRNASVVRPEFTIALLAELSGLSGGEVATLLEAAADAGLVRRSDHARWMFDHSLIAETLYAELDPAVRRELHRRAGEALERLYAADLEPHTAELAHHFLAAGDPGKGVHYARRAGESALARTAYDDAVTFYRRAVDAATDAGWPDVDRLTLLLGLASAERRAGRAHARRRTSTEAAELARRLGDANGLARAALLLAADGSATWMWQSDELVRAHLEEALEVIGPEDSALRVRLLGRLAQELQFGEHPARTAALTEEAVRMARRVGGRSTLGDALMHRHLALLGVAHPDERTQIAEQIIELGEAGGQPQITVQGHLARALDALECGDVPTFDREVAAVERLCSRLRLPALRWQLACWRAMRALLDGRLDDAERLSVEARELGDPVYGGVAAAAHLMQLVQIRWWRGTAADVLPLVEAAAAQAGRDYMLLSVLSLLYTNVDRIEDARREFERFDAGDFARLPRHHSWFGAMVAFGWVAARLGDARRAAAIHGVLLPAADRYAIGGAGVSVLGPVALTLGMLAATMGEFDRAVEHFEAALERSRRAGDVLSTATTQVEHAATLLRRNRPGDREEARRLLEQADAAAQRLGSGLLRSRVREVEERAATAESAWIFRREGDVWAVGSADALVRVRDAKGMRYIARLLGQPNVEVPALELVSPGSGYAAAAPDPGEAGDLLDHQAKAAYRARLDALEDELEEARRFHDPERAAAAQEELEFLRSELARAVGLGGRDRRTGTPRERARLNVTRAIKDALNRIAADHDELGAHLRAAVRTGSSCVYRPGSDSPRWDIAD